MSTPMRMPRIDNQYFPLVGGLDVESAHLSRRPGLVMGGNNYESSSENGYERIDGYERFDGHARPSDATWSVIRVDADLPLLTPGQDVLGATSGATARLLATHSAPRQLILSRVAGEFTMGEPVLVSGASVGNFAGAYGDITSADDAAYSAMAADDLRTEIGFPPGSGPIRGVQWLGVALFAFRDNDAGTALNIWRSSPTGWQVVPLMREVAFTAGSGTQPAEGTILSKGAVTAVLRRVVLETGTFAAGTAAGRLVIDTVTGGAFTAGAFTAGITATAGGADTPIELLPGGRMDIRVHSFVGTIAKRMYCADGVNPAFEFDGITLTTIRTGMAVDKPRHLEVHRNHLFLFFGGSIQHSGIGSPYTWTAVTGAGELAAGDEVTGSSVLPGDADNSAMLVLTQQRTLILYGSNSTDWQLRDFNVYAGAQRWSVQNMGSPIAFDAQGVNLITQSDQFGNFNRAEVSSRIRRFLQGRTVAASVVNRAKTRMRIFFADGDGLSITPVGRSLAFMPIRYPHAVTCTCEAQIDGVARTFFGTADGQVFEADRGRSFDGAPITAWMKLAFNVMKSPGIRKRFRWAHMEVKPQSSMALRIQAEFSLGDVNVGLTPVITRPVEGLGAVYGVTHWGESYYGNPAQADISVRIDGSGTSLSLTILSESAQEMSHELQSMNIFYNPLRLDRP